MYKDDTILVVGQAKPSKEDAIYSLHGEFYVSFVVERATGKILDLECNTILSVTRNFVVSMLLGKSLKTDLDEMQQRKTWWQQEFAVFKCEATANSVTGHVCVYSNKTIGRELTE